MSATNTLNDDSTANVRTVYERSLRALRQDVGCTPERLVVHTELLNALRWRLDQQGKSQLAAECIAELRDVVQTLSNAKHRRALLVALMLDPEHLQPTLTERREDFNRTLRQSSNPALRAQSVDNVRTLERRENEGIEEVARLLAEGRYALEADTRSKDVPRKPIRGDGSPKLFVTSGKYLYYFSKAGVLTHNDTLVELAADGESPTRKLSIWRTYYSDPRPGVLGIEAIFGCRITDTKEDAIGGISARIEIFKDLNPHDEAYTCGYRITINSSRRSAPVVESQVSPYREKIEYHLTFAPPALPLRAWWFNSDSAVEGRIEPSQEERRHLDLLDEGRYVSKRFDLTATTMKLHFGIAWIWPE